MAKAKIYSLGAQSKKACYRADRGHMEFFEVLDQAVGAFKSGYPMPQANCGDSRVSFGIFNKKPKYKFEFLAKGDHIVEIKIDVKDLAANPKEYIDNMLECLNDGMKQAHESNRIIIPVSVGRNHLHRVK